MQRGDAIAGDVRSAFLGLCPQLGHLQFAVAVVVRHGQQLGLAQGCLQVIARLGGGLVFPPELNGGEQHLLEGLVAPEDLLRRIRQSLGRAALQRLVVRRVVIPVVGDNLRAGGNFDQILEDIIALPVEVVVRHVEEDFLLAVRIDRRELRGITAIVRVHLSRIDLRVRGEQHIGRLVVARRVRRDLDRGVSDDHLALHHFRGFVLEIEPDLRGVREGLADRRVVHLERDRAARRHPCRPVRRRCVGFVPDSVAAHRDFPVEAAAVRRHLRQPAREDVVHALAVARLERRRLQPLALGQRALHRRDLVVDHACSRHVIGRDVDDQVRLAQRPVRPPCGNLHQRVFAAFRDIARRASFDPVDQRLGFFGGQVLILREGAIVIVSVEGRHAVTADGLADHRREGLDLLIGRHVPGRDSVRLVAIDALVLQDRHNVVRVRDLRELGFLAAVGKHELRALDARHFGRGGRLAGDDIRQRRFDRVSRTVIDDLEILLRINDHRLARIGEAQRVADQLVLVIEDRNGEAVGLRFVSDRLARVGVRRVDQLEHDVGVFRGEVLDRLGRFQGAFVAIDVRHQNHRRGDRVVLQDVTQAGLVDQHVIVDFRADEFGCRSFARAGGEDDGGCAGEKC